MVRGAKRLGLHAHHADALVAMRRGKYPSGTMAVSVRTGQRLSKVAGTAELPDPDKED